MLRRAARTSSAILTAAVLVLGSVLAATPAQAATTTTLTYTVSADDPVTNQWPAIGWDCAVWNNWVNSSRSASVQTLNVSVTGDYTIADTRLDSKDGRIAILAGPYNPADVTNCVAEVDDLETVWLEEGVSYTILLAGLDGELGTFSYDIDGPGDFNAPARAQSEVSLSATPDTVTVGEAATLTATVTSSAPSTSVSGTVEFSADGTLLSIEAVDDETGVATLSVDSLLVGTHEITAVYTGNGTTYSSTTATATELTVAMAPSTTTLDISAPSILTGADALLTATVVGFSPTGEVEFFDGAILLGSATVTDGVATISSSAFAPGARHITADYPGDANNTASSSGPGLLEVLKHPTSVELSAAPNPVAAGQTVALHTQVSSASPGLDLSGRGEFFANGTSLGSVIIDADTGEAALSDVTLPAGTHEISVEYSGNEVAASASSPTPITVVVNKPAVVTPPTEPAKSDKGKTSGTVNALPTTGGVEANTLAAIALLTTLSGATLLLLRRRNNAAFSAVKGSV